MKNKNQMIELAIQIAVHAHRGQTDLSGQPYILHPLRVMMSMAEPEDMAAAVLHDVVEDCDVTLNDLRGAGLPEAVVVAVDCLTKRKGEAYERYLERVSGNPIARRVKLADLEDNMRLNRIPRVTERDRKRINKYQHAKNFLGGAQKT